MFNDALKKYHEEEASNHDAVRNRVGDPTRMKQCFVEDIAHVRSHVKHVDTEEDTTSEVHETADEVYSSRAMAGEHTVYLKYTHQ